MRAKRFAVLATTFAGLALAGQGCAAHSACCPPRAPGAPAPHAIHVVGVGEVQVAPDVARTSLGVQGYAATAQAAADSVNAQMKKVIAALEKAGVAKSDLRTSNLSLHFERHEPPRPEGPRLEEAETAQPKGAYRAENTVEVTLRDLDRAPEVIAAATSAGANSMYGLSFEIDDPAPHVKKARELAMKAAQADAQQLAELSGAKLGSVISVQDGSGDGGGGPMPMMAMREAAKAGPSVEGGRLTVRHSVTLVVELTE